jgi:hypothetical protein
MYSSSGGQNFITQPLVSITFIGGRLVHEVMVWWYQRLCNAILTSWWWAHVLETCRNKLIVKQNFCTSSWLITEINIISCSSPNSDCYFSKINPIKTREMFREMKRIEYINTTSLFYVYFIRFLKAWPEDIHVKKILASYKNRCRLYSSKFDLQMSHNDRHTISVRDKVWFCCCYCSRQLTKLLQRQFKMDRALCVNRSFLLSLIPLRPGTWCQWNINRGRQGNLEAFSYSI